MSLSDGNNTRAHIPLVDVSTSIKVVDFSADVLIEQRYKNSYPHNIEAVCSFPSSIQQQQTSSSSSSSSSCLSAVCAFKAKIGERSEVLGIVVEKEKAIDTYNDAIAAGHYAVMLQQDERDSTMLKASIGTMEPNEEVTITIRYVTELDVTSDKSIRLYLPASCGWTSTTPSSPSTSFPNSEIAGVTITLDMTSPVIRVTSTSHTVRYAPDDDDHHDDNRYKGQIYLLNNVSSSSPSSSPPPSYLSVDIAIEQPHLSLVHVAKGGFKLQNGGNNDNNNDDDERKAADNDGDDDEFEDDVAMISLFPFQDVDHNTTIIRSEIIFLVDRSGSMAGAKIKMVHETMQLFLHSLPEGTLFNIVGFGSHHTTLFNSPDLETSLSTSSKRGNVLAAAATTIPTVEYSDRSLSVALDALPRMLADMGGTSLEPPLRQILMAPTKPGIPRQIFLLTDGQVSNPDECIQLVRSHRSHTRVFTFGIGSDVDRRLVTNIAKEGGGEVEFVQGGQSQDLNIKVLTQLRKAIQPALIDVCVNFFDMEGHHLVPGNIVRSLSPFHMPPIWHGCRIVFYVRFAHHATAALASSATLLERKSVLKAKITAASATHGQFEACVDIHLDTSHNQNNDNRASFKNESDDIVRKLASYSLIRSLEEGCSGMHDAKGHVTGGVTKKDVVDAILRTSIKNQILSKYTSFIVVEKRKEPIESTPKLVEIEVRNDKDHSPQQSQHQHTNTTPASSSSAPPSSFGVASLIQSGLRLFGLSRSSSTTASSSSSSSSSTLSPTTSSSSSSSVSEKRRLREVSRNLERRQRELERHVKIELQNCKKSLNNGNKQDAIVALRKKKMYESQIQTLKQNRETTRTTTMMMVIKDAVIVRRFLVSPQAPS
eukprot:TRINITY_DN4647_c0_g1_i6.p1 TRINITY_DN4647_c0_g1~~TRINITY_DN4647_c0_g1_i6.p1  ORF type:complete len:888 (-),score=180.76 TRINITY_DN4647_c0_g1_i6:60-2693(-)